MTYDKHSDHSDVFEYGVDVVSRSVWLRGDVSEASVFQTIQGILMLERADKSAPITLFINSEGGELNQALALIDVMQASSFKIKGVVLGYAYSAALIVLQACHIREVGANAVLMSHMGSRPDPFSLKLDMRADKLMMGRMKEKDPKYTMTKFQAWQNHDRYLFADEAIKLGIADRLYKR